MKKKKESFVEKNKKQIITIAVALVVLLGGTYAWLQFSKTGNKTVKIEAGTLALTLSEDTNAINLADALPLTDEEGLATDPYTFTIENTGTITSEYTIYLDNTEKDENEVEIDDALRIADEAISYNLAVQNGESTTGTLYGTLNAKNERVLASGTIEPGTDNKITYDLRLWINGDATEEQIHVLDENNNYVESKLFASKLRIEASQIKE